MIKRLILILPLLVLMVGCVQEDLVRSEDKKLSDRITVNEQKIAELEARLNDLEAQNEKWENSLDSISKASERLDDLEALVNRAEAAAEKASRSFDRGQQKGR